MFHAVHENLETFVDSYDEQFLDKYGFFPERAIETLREYLRCGLLQYGFARVRCPECRHEYLVAFITEGQPEVIDRILVHLGVDVVPPPPTGTPLWLHGGAELRLPIPRTTTDPRRGLPGRVSQRQRPYRGGCATFV